MGININSGRDTGVTGDIVGGDQTKTISITTTIYDRIKEDIDNKEGLSNEAKEYIKEVIDNIKEYDETHDNDILDKIETKLIVIANMAPDIMEVIAGTIANPMGGLALVFSKIMARMGKAPEDNK